MIKNINGQEVNVNPNLKKNNFNLRRLAAGLTVVGVIFTITACSRKKIEGFDFDQTSTTSLSDQYEQEYDVEFSPEEELLANKMEVYDITRDQFEEINDNKNASEIEKVDNRMELITQTRTISEVCLNSIKLKVKEAIGVQDANIEVNRIFDKGNGTYFYTIEITKNGSNVYTLSQNDIPDEMKQLVDEVAKLQAYKGDGENQVWDNDIDKFNKIGTQIYNDTLKFLDNDYEFDGSKLTGVVEEETKVR